MVSVDRYIVLDAPATYLFLILMSSSYVEFYIRETIPLSSLKMIRLLKRSSFTTLALPILRQKVHKSIFFTVRGVRNGYRLKSEIKVNRKRKN
jgi:hypothetical protein